MAGAGAKEQPKPSGCCSKRICLGILLVIAVVLGGLIYKVRLTLAGVREEHYKYHNPYADCGCERVWEPVCASIDLDEQHVVQGDEPFEHHIIKATISNKCEAECQSVRVFTPGQCEEEGGRRSIELNKCEYECPAVKRDDETDFVCYHNIQKPNRCHLNCHFELVLKGKAPLDDAEIEPWACKDPCEDDPCWADKLKECFPIQGKCFQEPCNNYECVDPTCEEKCNTRTLRPVCAKGISFQNKCFAECLELQDVMTEGLCPPDKRDPFNPELSPYGPSLEEVEVKLAADAAKEAAKQEKKEKKVEQVAKDEAATGHTEL